MALADSVLIVGGGIFGRTYAYLHRKSHFHNTFNY